MADESNVSRDPYSEQAPKVSFESPEALGVLVDQARALEERHPTNLDEIVRRAGPTPRLFLRQRSLDLLTVAAILLTCPMGCASLHPRHSQGTNPPSVIDRASPGPRADYPFSHEKEVSNLPSRIALATDDEPGEKMIISGTVYELDGVTPVPDAVLYLYHTDARGIYSDEECNNSCPRLRGYLKTDSAGHYEFSSIRPGHYTHIKASAHIHVHVSAPNQPEYTPPFGFYDDWLKSDEARAASDKKPAGFGLMQLKRDENGILRGVQHVKPPDPTEDSQAPSSAAPANALLEEELRKIMLDIMDDIQHGSARVYARYASEVVATERFTYTGDAGQVRRMIPIIPAHPLEKLATDLVDVRAREHGDTVILNYRQLDRTELKGKTFTKSSRKTVVFMRKDGNWQMVSYQSSPVGFERTVATIDPGILDSYAGAYQNPLWGTSMVTREGDALVFTSANGYRTEYMPESETEFFEKDEESREQRLQTVSFVRDDKGQVTHYVVRQNDGQNIVVRKVK